MEFHFYTIEAGNLGLPMLNSLMEKIDTPKEKAVQDVEKKFAELIGLEQAENQIVVLVGMGAPKIVAIEEVRTDGRRLRWIADFPR